MMTILTASVETTCKGIKLPRQLPGIKLVELIRPILRMKMLVHTLVVHSKHVFSLSTYRIIKLDEPFFR